MAGGASISPLVRAFCLCVYMLACLSLCMHAYSSVVLFVYVLCACSVRLACIPVVPWHTQCSPHCRLTQVEQTLWENDIAWDTDGSVDDTSPGSEKPQPTPSVVCHGCHKSFSLADLGALEQPGSKKWTCSHCKLEKKRRQQRERSRDAAIKAIETQREHAAAAQGAMSAAAIAAGLSASERDRNLAAGRSVTFSVGGPGAGAAEGTLSSRAPISIEDADRFSEVAPTNPALETGEWARYTDMVLCVICWPLFDYSFAHTTMYQTASNCVHLSVRLHRDIIWDDRRLAETAGNDKPKVNGHRCNVLRLAGCATVGLWWHTIELCTCARGVDIRVHVRCCVSLYLCLSVSVFVSVSVSVSVSVCLFIVVCGWVLNCCCVD